jgi:hypothetical protein
MNKKTWRFSHRLPKPLKELSEEVLGLKLGPKPLTDAVKRPCPAQR